MILVLLGTQNNSFHRLLEEVHEIIPEKPTLIQRIRGYFNKNNS